MCAAIRRHGSSIHTFSPNLDGFILTSNDNIPNNKTIGDIVAEILEAKRKAGVSKIHLHISADDSAKVLPRAVPSVSAVSFLF